MATSTRMAAAGARQGDPLAAYLINGTPQGFQEGSGVPHTLRPDLQRMQGGGASQGQCCAEVRGTSCCEEMEGLMRSCNGKDSWKGT